MMVVDASVIIDLLLGIGPHAPTIRDLLRTERRAAAPHLLDAEVAQVVRRRVAAGSLRARDARTALSLLGALPITRYPHLPLIARAFALRDNATIYDGLYLVLAEALGAVLLTRDRALASIPGCRADVQVLS